MRAGYWTAVSQVQITVALWDIFLRGRREGGPLAIVKDGDEILIDVNEGKA